MMYLVNFMVYPLIEKYLLKPYLKKDEGEEAKKETPALSEETEEEKRRLFKSDYVYVNGRLIRREELQDQETTMEDTSDL